MIMTPKFLNSALRIASLLSSTAIVWPRSRFQKTGYGGEPKKQICALNVAFGEKDNKTLFISACDAVYKIRLKVAGIAEGPQ